MKPVSIEDIVMFTEEKDSVFFFETNSGEVFVTSLEEK